MTAEEVEPIFRTSNRLIRETFFCSQVRKDHAAEVGFGNKIPLWLFGFLY